MNQIGKLFFTGLTGTELTIDEEIFIKDYNLGGVILFSKNFESRAQLKTLCAQIKKISPDILIATDHEGGRVQRFRHEFTEFPSMMDISKLGSPKLCFQVHEQMAKELRFCGVNVNLSPCTDILIDLNCNVIGDRSFGSTKEIVAEFSSSAVRGLQTNGVLSCIKHFPGHGNTSIDSHEDLPIIEDSLETIIERDLFPFRRAAKSKSGFVMMAHLKIPALDPENMTTISKKAYELCRDQLRFSGIIITDDMEMGAIEKNYGTAEAAEMAIFAGATMLEYRSFDKTREVVTALSGNNGFMGVVESNAKIISTVKKNHLNINEPLGESIFIEGERLNSEIREQLSKIT